MANTKQTKSASDGSGVESDDWRLALAGLEKKLAEANGRIAVIENAVGELRLSVPRIEKTLSSEEVRQVIADDPSAEFRVTETFERYGAHLFANSTVRSTDRPQLPQLVQAGLMLVRKNPADYSRAV